MLLERETSSVSLQHSTILAIVLLRGALVFYGMLPSIEPWCSSREYITP
jgi:hypothetical protein